VRDLPDDNDLSASNFLLKFLPILVFQVWIIYFHAGYITSTATMLIWYPLVHCCFWRRFIRNILFIFGRVIVISELEVVVAWFKVFFQDLPGVTEENNENLPSVYPISGERSKAWIPRIRSRDVTTRPGPSVTPSINLLLSYFLLLQCFADYCYRRLTDLIGVSQDPLTCSDSALRLKQ
jgi:hypothetical protein